MAKEVSVDVSLKGQTEQVPALDVGGRLVVVDGRFFRVGRIHQEKWLEDDLEDLPSFLTQLRSLGTEGRGIDAFSFTQKLPELSPRYGFPTMPESVAAIPISTYQEWMDKLQRDARTDVRKAEKRGVTVRVSDLDDDFVRGIVGLYNETPVRQGKRFWHYGKQAEAVKRENSSFADRSVFLGAYLGEELVGFMKIVKVERIGAMMQILSKLSHREYRVSNALVAGAVRMSAERSWLYLTYGQYRYRNRDSSLTQFKHRAGFQEYLVPRYFVPLNGLGAMCVRLGLHRDLVDMVPPSLATLFVRIRAEYTARRVARGKEQGNA